MFILLSGADTFRSRKQLRRMLEKFKADRDPQGLNTAVLDCEKEEAEKIWPQLLAAPFLAEKRMVTLENLLTAAKKQALQEEMLARIKENRLPPATVIVFWESDDKPKTNAAKELWKILSAEKYSQNFEQLTGAKWQAWIAQSAKEKNANLAGQALLFIGQNIEDSWQADALLEQLAAYCQGCEIGLKDVLLFLEEKIDDDIFHLIDAIVAGQKKQVYQMIQKQYKKGEDAGYIFNMLVRQFRILLQLRDIFDREDNVNSDLLAKRLGLHPFVVKKSFPIARRFAMQQLKEIYGQLLEMDIKTKTGLAGQPLLLDLLVGKIASY